MTDALVGTIPAAALLVGVGVLLGLLRTEDGEGPLWFGFAAVAAATLGLMRSGAEPAQLGFSSDGVVFFQVVVCVATAGAIVLVAYGRLERPTRTCASLLIANGALVLLCGAATLGAAAVASVGVLIALFLLLGARWGVRLLVLGLFPLKGLFWLAEATDGWAGTRLDTLALSGSDDATMLAFACAVLTCAGVATALWLGWAVGDLQTPAPVAAWLAAPAVAAAALALRLRLDLGVFEPRLDEVLGSWSGSIAFAAAGLAFFSYGFALRAPSLAKAAAWFGVGQVALLGLAIAGGDGGAVAFGSFALVVTQLTLFALVAMTRAELGGSDLVRLRGMARRNPWLAGFLAVGLASAVGFPATAGFVGELGALRAVFGAKLLVPGGVALVAMALGVAAVIRILRPVYFARPVEPEGLEPLVTSSGLTIVCAAFAATILWLGVSPGGLLGFTEQLNLLAGQQ